MAGGIITSGATSVTYTTDNAWRIWNGVHASVTGYTTTSSTDGVWHTWVNINSMPRRAPRSEAEQLVRMEAIAARYEVERVTKEKAARRARALLVENLSGVQRECYEKNGYFDVEVAGKTYRIKQGTHGNVALVDGAGPIERYCVQPDGVPDEDAMLAQKLALDFAPEEFFKKANVTRIRN